MGSNPLAALGIKTPQVEGPLDQFAKGQQVRNLMQTNEMNQAKIEQNKQSQQMQKARSALFIKHQGDVDKVIEESRTMGLPVYDLIEEKQKTTKLIMDMSKEDRERRKELNDWMGGAASQILQLPPEQRGQAVAMALNNAVQQGLLTQDQVQEYLPIAQLPPEQMQMELQLVQAGSLGSAKLYDAAQKREERTAMQKEFQDYYKTYLEANDLKPNAKRELEVFKEFQQARKERVDVPGVDVPYSPDVMAQKRELATAGQSARAAEQEPLIETAAQGLIEPRNLTALKDIASLRTDQRLKIYARAKQLDPSFDPGLVNQRIRFLQAYENPTGRAAINRQAINNILQHAGDLSRLNKNYSRANVRFVNTPINAIARQMGEGPYIDFATTMSVLKDELSLYFAGGYAPTEDQQRSWDRILNETATPQQVEAFAREVIRLGLRRATTFNSQFKKNMGYDDPNMIVPEALTAGQELGLGSELQKFGSGGQLTGGSGPSGQAQDFGPAGGKPEGSTGTLPDGTRVIVRNGRIVRQ